MVATLSPVRRFHSLTRPSEPLDSSCMPRVANVTFKTELVWPSKVRRQLRSDRAQMRTVASPEHEAST